jgi:hypothetical protein
MRIADPWVRADTISMANDSLPLRKSDMFFVMVVVMLALSLPTKTTTLMAVGGGVLLWIRFRVYGGRDQ